MIEDDEIIKINRSRVTLWDILSEIGGTIEVLIVGSTLLVAS
jgi:hypothetical protein